MDFFQRCLDFADADLVRSTGLYPYFQTLSASDGAIVTHNGRDVVMMGSNNYLGLTHHPEVKEAARAAVERYGTGCTGSRLLNGNLDLHEQLEVELAAFFKKEAALVYAAGFLANTGALSCVGHRGTVIFSDSENHASIIEGTRLAHSEVRIFRGLRDLEKQLAARDEWRHAMVVTEGIFSMTGRIGPLAEIVALKQRYGFRLFLDDAHGIGVLGPMGRGTSAHLGVEEHVDMLCGTFSKSLASVGGFIAGPRKVLDYMRHKSRTLIFTAALPPASSAAALAALHVMRREPDLFVRSRENAKHWREGLASLGYCTMGSKTSIVPVFVGSESLAFKFCHDLLEAGVFTTPVMHPAMPYGQALVRTSTSPMHEREHLDRALDAFGSLKQRYTLPEVDPENLPRAEQMDFSYFFAENDDEEKRAASGM